MLPEPHYTIFSLEDEIKYAFKTDDYPVVGDIVSMLKEIEDSESKSNSLLMNMYIIDSKEYEFIVEN